MTSPVNIETLAGILADAADTEIMPRFRNLGDRDVRQKTSAVDLVTEADEAAERLIKARCAEAFPDALFIGEESVAADPALLPRLAEAELAIVVDPIDGTANFAAGLPAFGVMASVVAKGETVGGLLYDPFCKDFLLAEKGAGAFLDRRGQRSRIAVANPVPLDEMVGSGGASYFEKDLQGTIFANLHKLRIVGNYRCAQLEYWAMATGAVHFLFFGKLMPWDHLAGALIVEEAGGMFRRLDGSAYRPRHVGGGLLVATDEASWEVLSREIFGG
ncbi:inositol monophosphatase [Aureimonas endophytica]|uniref:Inositol monophosphatase n=1 Tax=Aureimonas endophytica TaxID=2027858 RepID=A0A916ZE32_9HYPH|nr:inositol monophosphatase family protein [Aureimonas endophytica]GGD91125.1 inositol monophosphatase [Aureimonas endophytica]